MRYFVVFLKDGEIEWEVWVDYHSLEEAQRGKAECEAENPGARVIIAREL